jgi:hypothetical protein
MILLSHVAQCKYATWHLKMNLMQNINIKLVGTQVGATNLSYIPTYLLRYKGR